MNKLKDKLDELFGIDIRALALLRIGFSLLILIDLIQAYPYIKAFYTDQGMLPNYYAQHLIGHVAICFNLVNGSLWYQFALYFLFIGFTLGLMLGYRTRVCTIMVWLFLISFYNRNLLIVGAEDTILTVLFFWLLFLPWGECYSMDRFFQKKAPVFLRVSSMASVAFLLQICFVYFFTGYFKNHPEWTINRTAMMVVLSGDQFIKPWAHSLMQYPDLLKFITAFVLNLERWGPFLFFFPFKTKQVRLLITIIFMCFHLGILWVMELNLFQWFSLISLIVFLPSSIFDKFFGILRNESYVEINKESQGRKINLFSLPSYLSIALGFLIVYTLVWNIGELRHNPYIVPAKIKWIGQILNIKQHWGMFAPNPYKDDGWFVIQGKLKDGKTIDVFNDGKSLDWKEPQSIPERNKNYRLTLFYCRIHRSQFSFYLKPWANFICDNWNSRYPPKKQLQFIDIIFMQRDLNEQGIKPIPKKIQLFTQDCFREDNSLKS